MKNLNLNRIYSYLTVIVFLSFVISCNKYEEDVTFADSRYLSFTASLAGDSRQPGTKSISPSFIVEEGEWILDADDPNTKVSPLTLLQDAGDVGVVGFLGTKNDNGVCSWGNIPINSLNNVKYTFDGDQLSTESPVLWSSIGADSLSLYAFAPQSIASEVTYTNNAASFTYTADTDVTKQKDIIAASRTVKSGYNSPVHLDFNHALVAICFKTELADVKSVTVSNVYNKGIYTIGKGWTVDETSKLSYTVSGSDISDAKNTLMLIPQTLPEDAEIILEFNDNTTISTSIAGKEWKPGKMITYSLKKKGERPVAYFDLAAGNVILGSEKFSGAIYCKGEKENKEYILTDYTNGLDVYVYQSTSSNKGSTGDVDGNGTITLPVYKPVEYKGRPWSEYITNNTSVEAVIEAWDNWEGAVGADAPDGVETESTVEKGYPNGKGAAGAVRNAGREGTKYRIHVAALNDIAFKLTIDNIYSTYQQHSNSRSSGGIAFLPGTGCKMKLNIVGDNRVGCVHILNSSSDNNNKLMFEGSGSLTVADVDYYKKSANDAGDCGDYNPGYYSNWWCSAIGGNDSRGTCYGIEINSGVIFAGTTKAENCTAIGAGGNDTGEITINGGTVTAVSTTTGTAIGGGIGFHSAGGTGYVTITGGNIYAYNFGNRWNIPSSAIGGAGSSASTGASGTVTITGGNVYAQSTIGTAIGGGSSQTKSGGNAIVTISGGKVVAKSLPGLDSNGNISIQAGAGIGGGTGASGGNKEDGTYNGGTAEIKIKGNAILRTGSIGGGLTSDGDGKIGSADIEISSEGGIPDIQAQFVMAKGSDVAPKFVMKGGKIRNSNTADDEYHHIKSYGGAVYMERGRFSMSGGSIENCRAEKGGAVYILGDSDTEFLLDGGTIKSCVSEQGGGAVYLEGGKVTVSKGTIVGNVVRNGNGGGVSIMDGNFSMTGGSISKNSSFSIDGSSGKGGGVYVSSDGDVIVDLLSGEIIGNTSALLGGGICVEMPDKAGATADIVVGTKDVPSNEFPKVTDNLTLLQGGGLYVSGKKSNMVIHSGTILGNSTSGYVANPNVVNEGGSVTLLSETATTSVKVTFNGNDGTDSPVTENHLIVSATNSIIKTTGVYERAGYNLVGWHTRSDGDDFKGKFFPIQDGVVTVNVESDLILYAVWKRQGA